MLKIIGYCSFCSLFKLVPRTFILHQCCPIFLIWRMKNKNTEIDKFQTENERHNEEDIWLIRLNDIKVILNRLAIFLKLLVFQKDEKNILDAEMKMYLNWFCPFFLLQSLPADPEIRIFFVYIFSKFLWLRFVYQLWDFSL